MLPSPRQELETQGSQRMDKSTSASSNCQENTKKPKKELEKMSDAWNHFTPFMDEADNRRKARCNHCDMVYFFYSKKNGTRNLNNHLNTCKRIPQRTSTTQTQLSLEPVCEGVGSLSKWSFDQSHVSSQLAYMIVFDELPFKFVERDGFRTFMAAAQPLFKIPSRFTIQEIVINCILMRRRNCKLALKNWLKCLYYYKHLDFIAEDQLYVHHGTLYRYQLDVEQKIIINFCSIDSHRGEELGRAIDGCLREWGIAKVFSITVDSLNDTCVIHLKTKMSARECAWAKGKYLHMRCIAHIINLVMVDGLKEINESIKKVRVAIRWVRNSPARLAKFRDCCEDENIECKSLLCLDVPTRWNSTYLMLEVAQNFEKAFERFEIKDPYFRDELSEGVSTTTDWENARMMVDILSIFYELTLRISGSLYVTSNEFYHEISSVNCSIKEWMGRSEDANVKAVGERMKAKYDKYWGSPKDEQTNLYCYGPRPTI